MRNIFKDKVILITGATGSFGEQLVPRILAYAPKVVRCYSRDETKQFHMLQKLGNRRDVRYFIGDVRDYDRLLHAMEDVDYVFHLAAMKHVFACEYNPFEAMKTNIVGTANVIEAAIEAKVNKVVFTSTDKAVNPCNVMGTSKLFAEHLITAGHYYRGTHKTVFCSVRFGNVLGSRGSVIPLIEKQIQSGNTVTMTDANMERYVMSLNECLKFVFEVVEIAIGGEVFVLKMPIVRVRDLIKALIELIAPKYNKDPKSIKIKSIGMLPGEKFSEELITEDEMKSCYELKNMYVILPQMRDLIQTRTSYEAKYAKVTTPQKEYLNKNQIKSLLKKSGILEMDD